MYNSPFKWWVQSVMPVVFDDSLSYYEVLAKLTKYIEGLTGDVKEIEKVLETIEGISDVTEFTRFLETIQSEIGNISNLQTDNKSNLVNAINELALKAQIAYYKQPGGIPESDLSEDVRDKLNRSGEAAEYIINNKTLKKAPNNNSSADLGLGTYSVPVGGIPWDTLSKDVQDRIDAGGGGTGGTKDYTELINKPEIDGHTLNAGNNTHESLGLGTYTKPVEGIPESDLSEEVQNKLNTSGGIADDEVEFVATRDYEAGELIYINGVLYKTKYKILSGTNLVPGNNIEETDISSEIERINNDIDALQSGSGPDSWSLVYNINRSGTATEERFFEYFNAIGGEDYLFICTPNPTQITPYSIKIYKRDGTLVDTQEIIDYTNQYRFTFTPTDTGEYYCTNVPIGGNNAITVRVELEYTESQGISELWAQVNKSAQVEPRVEALETLVGQQQEKLENLDDIPQRVTALEENVDNLSGAFDALEPYDEVELSFTSGGISGTGAKWSVNKRIRVPSTEGTYLVAKSGDKIFVDNEYLVSAFAYNGAVISTANLYRRFAQGLNGDIYIPDDCVDKHIALSISKIGDEENDISGDIPIMGEKVKYYQVSPVLLKSKVDTTLTIEGDVAESKATGDAIHTLNMSIVPELDSSRFIWNIGNSITANGGITNNSSFALTDIIPVKEMNIIQNIRPDTGEDDQITALMIALFDGENFITGSRKILAYNEYYKIPAGADGMRIAYGYTSANPSPKIMNRRRLADYFGVKFLNNAQPVGYIGDGEQPVYVAFGASTVEGRVHHQGTTVTTVSKYNFPDYIGRTLNLKTYNLGVGSTGFMARGDVGYQSYGEKPNIMDQIFNNDTLLSQAKLITITFGYGNDHLPSEAHRDKIFHIGSYTDYYPYDEEGYHPSGGDGIDTMLDLGATLMGCLNWCIKWINEKYPYAQLIIIFGSPSANDGRDIALTPQTGSYGTPPYTLSFSPQYTEPTIPFESGHPTMNEGIWLINEELKKLKAAMDIPIINLFFEGNAFSYYSTYAKDPNDNTKYALFSTKGTEVNPTWNSHPNDLGYKYYAKFIGGKVVSLFKH